MKNINDWRSQDGSSRGPDWGNKWLSKSNKIYLLNIKKIIIINMTAPVDPVNVPLPIDSAQLLLESCHELGCDRYIWISYKIC